jgi:hypothetical protein
MLTKYHRLRRVKVDGQEDRVELLGPAKAILTREQATELAVALNLEATRVKHDSQELTHE